MVAELNTKKIQLIERLLAISDESVISDLLSYFSDEKQLDMSLGNLSENDLKDRLIISQKDIAANNTKTQEEMREIFKRP